MIFELAAPTTIRRLCGVQNTLQRIKYSKGFFSFAKCREVDCLGGLRGSKRMCGATFHEFVGRARRTLNESNLIAGLGMVRSPLRTSSQIMIDVSEIALYGRNMFGF
jgi:hypothetical protein